MQEKLFESQYLKLEIEEEILFATFKKGNLTLDIAKQMVEDRHKFCQKKSYPVLIKDLGIKSMNLEARKYFTSREGLYGIKAGAILSTSSFGVFLANFFINVTNSREKMPTKIFRQEKDALKWLKQFKFDYDE